MKFSIEQARNYAGLTQAEMAKKLSMSTNSYNEYENGKHYFRVDKAYLFSKIVGMDTSTIIFFTEELHLECSD